MPTKVTREPSGMEKFDSEKKTQLGGADRSRCQELLPKTTLLKHDKVPVIEVSL
jgi:hypothetical protein